MVCDAFEGERTMPRRPIVGVVGSGNDFAPAMDCARQLGELLVAEGWIVLSGGRNAGVMKAVSEGVKKRKGLSIGILPNASVEVCPDVDVAIITDLNNARNNLIGLSSNVLIACGIDGPGTASEVALALKNGKKVILLGVDAMAQAFFSGLGGENVLVVDSPQRAVQIIKEYNLC
jgi:uncharacterized protein (TIGR00725 family)